MTVPLALATFAAAAAIAAGAVLVCRSVALRFGILDRPGAHKGHAMAVPLLGGIGALGAAAIAVVAGPILARIDLARPAGLLALLGGLLLVVVTGLVDDLVARGLLPWQKLAGQGGAAVVATIGLGLAVGNASGSPILDAGFRACVLVLATNAFNLLDNANGLCAGTGLVLALGLGCLASPQEPALAVAAFALAGGLAGFLPWNYPRARIFLGDAGSHGIGFTLALLALATGGAAQGAGRAGHLAFSLPATLFALPFLDVAWVVAKRRLERRPVFVGDRGHLSHRLVAAGLSPAAAVAILWTYAGVTAALALALPVCGGAGAALVVCAAWTPGLVVAARLLVSDRSPGR